MATYSLGEKARVGTLLAINVGEENEPVQHFYVNNIDSAAIETGELKSLDGSSVATLTSGVMTMVNNLDLGGQNIINCPNVLTNPLQSDLDGDQTNALINVNNYDNFVLVDALPSNPDGIYKESLVTGAVNRQPGQDDFDPVTTNFPTGRPLFWANKLPIEAIPGIIGRRTGATLPPGTIGNQIGFGTKLLFQDRVIYDPLNLRYNPTAPNSFSACRFHSGLPGYTAGGAYKAMVTIHVHLEGSFAGANNNNLFRVFCRQFDSAGVFIRDYNILESTGRAATNVVVTGSRYLMSFAPYSEDINDGDYLEIWAENAATSPNNFTFTLMKGVIEYRPVP